MHIEINLPEKIKSDLEKAFVILTQEGCTEVYLFGSFAQGNFNSYSDMDIAVKGLPKSRFFKVYGELLEKIDTSIDLIGLDYNNDFVNELNKTGKLIRVR